MARIRRGTGNRPRKNAKNYTHKHAQRRFDETIAPFNKQVENSLFVDAVEIDYYQTQKKTGRACTCNKVEVRPEHTTMPGNMGVHSLSPVIPTAEQDGSAKLGITLRDNDIFGDSGGEKLFGETIMDVSAADGFEDDDIPVEIYDRIERREGDVNLEETSMYGSGAACGICYRIGMQPGYTAYGKQRTLLTNWDIAEISGYTVDTTSIPNVIKRQGPAADYCYVDFMIHVPKYFKACIVSVRNNTKVLIEEKILVNGQPVSMAILRSFAGREMPVQIRAAEFTHVVLEFDLGLDKIRADLGPESRALEYDRVEPLSNFPVVLPPSIHDVNTGDIIAIKARRLVLRVTDVERKITADMRQLEWVVQTRLVQKTEALRDIAKGFKLM